MNIKKWKETTSSALYLISSYYNMIEGEKNYAEQTHNKIKFVHYVGEQCKIKEIQEELSKIILTMDMIQDGCLIFIGNNEISFIEKGLERIIQKPSWAENIGQIQAIHKLHMAIKEKK